MPLPKQAAERVEKAEENGLCLACLEPLGRSDRQIRGVHDTCYKALMRACKRGDVTEQDLIRQGRLFAAKKAGRKPNHKALKGLLP